MVLIGLSEWASMEKCGFCCLPLAATVQRCFNLCTTAGAIYNGLASLFQQNQAQTIGDSFFIQLQGIYNGCVANVFRQGNGKPQGLQQTAQSSGSSGGAQTTLFT
jgi:hypothetical protein